MDKEVNAVRLGYGMKIQVANAALTLREFSTFV